MTMDSPVWVYMLGFAGMGIYGLRILIQWYMSEKSRHVESPGIYWVLSSIGAVVLYLYGWLRKDFSIIFGESVGYYIYMWNISVLGLYKRVPRFVVILQALFPLVILALIVRDFPTFTATFLRNEHVPLRLLLFGVLGQSVYELRSVYQLVYSYKRKASILPLGHWVMAVTGSVLIIIYGLIRHDWVLAVGQFSIVFSIRNIMISVSSMKRMKGVPLLLMVRPSRFGYNEQTASDNHFQRQSPSADVQEHALEEFDAMVRVLEEHDIPVLVAEDTPESENPDSVFPNNWFSTHPDGTLVLYPMFAPNRRNERDPAIIRMIMEAAGTRRIVDLSDWEDKGKFLESTGSMVLDRKGRIAYACRSPRTSEAVLEDFCRRMGFNSIVFDAVDREGNPIYHTNVMLALGERFALLCEDVVISPPELTELESNLLSSGRKIIRVTYGQMRHFACNVLEVRNRGGERFVVMSDTAMGALTESQLAVISEDATILPVHIPYIEQVGGGSARCMMAEVIPSK